MRAKYLIETLGERFPASSEYSVLREGLAMLADGVGAQSLGAPASGRWQLPPAGLSRVSRSQLVQASKGMCCLSVWGGAIIWGMHMLKKMLIAINWFYDAESNSQKNCSQR